MAYNIYYIVKPLLIIVLFNHKYCNDILTINIYKDRDKDTS